MRPSPTRSALVYLLPVLGCAGLILLSFAGLSAIVPLPPLLFALTPPSIEQRNLSPTAPPTGTAIAVAGVTPTSASATPAGSPTPIPSPTVHHVVPANPTPRPTPELPPAAPFPTSCDGPGRMNLLLIGVDGRSANYARAARADAIAVAGINFTQKNAQLLSIPRDLWVQIAADANQPERVVENRINTAFASGQLNGYPGGGPRLLGDSLSRNFGLRIDRFVVVNFYAFEQAVDAVGGLDIDVPKAIHDKAYPAPGGGTMVVDIPAGRVHMDGATALIYARTRHQDSDFGRMRRQQDILMAMRDKVFSVEVLPVLPNLTQLLLSSVHTDLGLEDIGLLGCVGPRIERQAIRQLVIDGSLTRSFTTSGGAQVLLPNMDAILPLLVDFNVGE